jgi:hypothetical protein
VAPLETDQQTDREQWWQSRWLLALLLVAAAIPLLTPETPPLVDLPGHIGRYRVQVGIDTSPFLDRYYEFHWALIGNLGIDLLIFPLAKLFGIETGAKLIVMAIPVMTVAGMLGIAKEAHGRLPPTAFFALPLAYSYPFQFGFVNFALSMALALTAFALWLKLGRLGRIGLRAALFVPISTLIWVSHTFGWGLLGVLAFAAEVVRERERGRSRLEALLRGAVGCLPLVLPFVLMLLWRSGAVAGSTGGWFRWRIKGIYLISILREQWQLWDLAAAVLVMGLPLLALGRFGFRLRHSLALAAALLILLYVLLPRVLFGSAFADMRLAPFMIAIAVLAVAPAGIMKRRYSETLAIAGLVFFGARLAVSTVTFADLDRAWNSQLAAIAHIAPGSRVLVQANVGCTSDWKQRRMEHIGSLAIVRRDAFTNDQWTMPGAQLVTARYTRGWPFVTDPSQIMRPPRCRFRNEAVLEQTLKIFRRDAFDYVWFIDLPPSRWPQDPQLAPVWQGETGILYRVVASPTKAKETPKGKRKRRRRR